jgi:hypothetical protein
MGTNKKKSARLVLKTETLRELRSLSDDQLRAAAGGLGTGGRATEICLPSCNRC